MSKSKAKSVFETVLENVCWQIDFMMDIGKNDTYIEEKICDRLSKLELEPDDEVNESAHAIDGSLLDLIIKQKRSGRMDREDEV